MPTAAELLADVRDMQADILELETASPTNAKCDYRPAGSATVTTLIPCVQGENPVIEEMVVLGGGTTDNEAFLNVVRADFPQEPAAGDEIRFPATSGAWYLIRTVTRTQGDPTRELHIKKAQ